MTSSRSYLNLVWVLLLVRISANCSMSVSRWLLLNMYGMNEIMWCFDSNFEKTLEGSVGSLAPGCICKLLGNDGKEIVDYNMIGELCVKGPTLTPGYYNNAEANAKAFEDGFFHTGDLFKINEKGNFTYIDRLTDMIEYKFHYIIPQDIEVVLMSHPLVVECAAVGFFDEKEISWYPRAYVTLAKNTRDIEEVRMEILRIAETGLSEEKQLREGLIIVKDLPRNSNGKIQRHVLRQSNALEIVKQLRI